MKEKLKGAFVGASITALLMGGLTFAASRSETVQRFFRDINITLNGKTVTPKDANGKIVEPFIIDGTTYLPIRAVGEAMGLQVGWDDMTSTVSLRNADVDWKQKQNLGELLKKNSNVKLGTEQDVIIGNFILGGRECALIVTVDKERKNPCFEIQKRWKSCDTFRGWLS